MSSLSEININKNDIVYIDETGFATSTYRRYGHSKKGTRCYGTRCAQQKPRISLIAGYLHKKLIAPLIFTGTCNQLVFNTWLKKALLPILSKGSIIILDNATFHRSNETLALVAEAECKLLFLPPYSPHLNPIEKMWGSIKRSWSYHSQLTIEEFLEKCDYLSV